MPPDLELRNSGNQEGPFLTVAPACILEADPDTRAEISRALRTMGYKTYETPNREIALFIASQVKLRVMVIDVLTMGGLDLIKRMRETAPQVRIVALSSGGRAGLPLFLELAHHAGAHATLSLPVAHTLLCEAMHNLATIH